jgi:hypothetical protein
VFLPPPMEGLDHERSPGAPAARRLRRVVGMIALAVVGMGLIIVLAGVVGVVDAARASVWRAVAAERRQNWEDRSRHATPEPALPA